MKDQIIKRLQQGVVNYLSGDGKVYFNSRRPTIGNQDIEIILNVKGNVGEATGKVLMKGIDELLGRLRVCQQGAELAPHD